MTLGLMVGSEEGSNPEWIRKEGGYSGRGSTLMVRLVLADSIIASVN